MGQCRTVQMSELMDGNERMCLSAKRVFGKCHLCRKYDTCESRIVNPNVTENLEKIQELKADLKEKEKELENLENEIKEKSEEIS